jgi:predicted acetyltransferase
MADSNATLLLIESRFGPVGQVRFDKDREVSYSIDYSVSPVFRGFGLGALILIKSIKFFEKMNRDFVLVANVKSTNIASIKIFKQLKFCKSSSDKDNFVRFSLKKC